MLEKDDAVKTPPWRVTDPSRLNAGSFKLAMGSHDDNGFRFDRIPEWWLRSRRMILKNHSSGEGERGHHPGIRKEPSKNCARRRE
jgi:hypothetical protein